MSRKSYLSMSRNVWYVGARVYELGRYYKIDPQIYKGQVVCVEFDLGGGIVARFIGEICGLYCKGLRRVAYLRREGFDEVFEARRFSSLFLWDSVNLVPDHFSVARISSIYAPEGRIC